MGGIIAMLLGTTSLQKHLVRLVINGIGPELPARAIQQITKYISRHSTFNNFSGTEAVLSTGLPAFWVAY
jgi:hypothetical protein